MFKMNSIDLFIPNNFINLKSLQEKKYTDIGIKIELLKNTKNAIITLKCALYHICDAVLKF